MEHCVVDLAQSSNAGNVRVGVAGGIIRSGAAPGGGSCPSSGDAWLVFAVDGGAQAPLGSRVHLSDHGEGDGKRDWRGRLSIHPA